MSSASRTRQLVHNSGTLDIFGSKKFAMRRIESYQINKQYIYFWNIPSKFGDLTAYVRVVHLTSAQVEDSEGSY